MPSKSKWQTGKVSAIIVFTALVIMVAFLLLKISRDGANPARSSDYRPETTRRSAEDSHSLAFSSNNEHAVFKNFLPAISKGDEIVYHYAYTLCYSPANEEARWVAYTLTKAMVSAKGRRQGDFRRDPAVADGSATPGDYKHSGFDRGHLVPAADMKWSDKAQSECFLMSNISPQRHKFNAGIWEDLERDARRWAKENGRLYIVTGPILQKGLPTIGRDQVSVPNCFYKIILDSAAHGIQEIAFIIPNEAATHNLWYYAVSVKAIEQSTGIDFFPALPDTLEKKIESQLLPAPWKEGLSAE